MRLASVAAGLLAMASCVSAVPSVRSSRMRGADVAVADAGAVGTKWPEGPTLTWLGMNTLISTNERLDKLLKAAKEIKAVPKEIADKKEKGTPDEKSLAAWVEEALANAPTSNFAKGKEALRDIYETINYDARLMQAALNRLAPATPTVGKGEPYHEYSVTPDAWVDYLTPDGKHSSVKDSQKKAYRTWLWNVNALDRTFGDLHVTMRVELKDNHDPRDGYGGTYLGDLWTEKKWAEAWLGFKENTQMAFDQCRTLDMTCLIERESNRIHELPPIWGMAAAYCSVFEGTLCELDYTKDGGKGLEAYMKNIDKWTDFLGSWRYDQEVTYKGKKEPGLTALADIAAAAKANKEAAKKRFEWFTGKPSPVPCWYGNEFLDPSGGVKHTVCPNGSAKSVNHAAASKIIKGLMDNLGSKFYDFKGVTGLKGCPLC